MLYNQEFLQQLDECRTKTVYARIIALTLDELPLETIEGRVTQGSVNIDGDSAVRRTCSLTMAAKDYDYNAFIWGLNTKFKLEVGLENTVDSNYPDIIWFKQGTYFISQFSTSQSTNNFTISIQGKDKMCALNGEIGGMLTSSVVFDSVEDIVTLPSGEHITKITKLTLKEIIRNMVHLYGGEPLHNIIINDLDISGLELLEYRYEQPLYLYRTQMEWNFADGAWTGMISNNPDAFTNVTLNGKTECKILKYNAQEDYPWEEEGESIAFDQLQSEHLQLLVSPLSGTQKPTRLRVYNNLTQYIDIYLAKINHGDTAGYRFTDLTYPGDLIGAVGETLTSILDKIKNMLGNYEYFYDLNGQFIFQQKKNKINSGWSPASTDTEGKVTISFDNNCDYTFKNGTLVTTFNNNPNLNNLKNDYSVWGERQGISGKPLPVHMRYAIDQKPTYYKNLKGEEYKAEDYDWRELIYQMAKDYYANTNDDDFASKLAAANPSHFSSGKTGYENYYTDLIGFWRELYDPFSEQELTEARSIVLTNKQEQDEIINDSTTTTEEKTAAKKESERLSKLITDYENKITAYKQKYYDDNSIYKYWNTTVYEAPQNLNFWFDFLDTDGELSQYSVKNIGCRPKAINDSSVKAIYFRETPNIVFTKNLEEDSKNSSGYTYVQINEQMMKTMFTISAQGKSAKMAIDDLLYKHSYCIESTTINTIPIYYLEPNSYIHVIDEATGLNGYYNVSKLSIPLTYNGTMSITATKAAQNI